MKSILRLTLSRVIVSVCGVLILAVSALSQSKPTVAVIPFAESGRAVYGGSEVSDVLAGELLSSGKFIVSDKSKTIIEADVLKSIKDSIDAPTAKELAQKSGARYLILGTLTEFGEKMKTSLYGVKSYESFVKFNLRTVDSQTGEVILTQTFEKRGISVGDANKAMQEAITKMAKDAVAAIIKKLTVA